MWIETIDSIPIADGDYRVITANGRETLMSYTKEGGWNTFKTHDGKLIGQDISEFVIMWFNPAVRKNCGKALLL